MKGFLAYAFGILLHFLVVAAHIILVVVGRNGHPLHLVRDTWFTEGLFTVVSYWPNAIGKAYLVGLLYYTQKLALRRNLNHEQSLTAAHDKSTAWLGLGSAIPVLWHQFSTAADVFGVVCIFLYFGGLFALGITTPILFKVAQADGNADRFINITNYLYTVGTNSRAIADNIPIVEILPLMDIDILTYGLEDYLIYDIPNFSGWHSVPVNAAAVNVLCQALPSVAQVGDFSTTNGTFTFHIHSDIQNIHVTPTIDSIAIVPFMMKDESVPPPSTMIIASTRAILDGLHNSTQSVAQFTPALVSTDPCPDTQNCLPLQSLQILACDVSVANMSGLSVYPLDGPKHRENEDIINTTTSWITWQLPQDPPAPELAPVHSLGEWSPLSGVIKSYHVEGESTVRNHTLSILEENVMNTLKVQFFDDDQQLTLGELNYVLSRAVAAVYWRAAMDVVIREERPEGEPELLWNVQISQWSPVIGLAVSTVMMILAAIMTRHVSHRDRIHKELGELGVLQLTWLLGGTKSRAEDLRDAVGKPKYKNLRKAGAKILVQGWSDLTPRAPESKRSSVNSENEKAGPTDASTAV